MQIAMTIVAVTLIAASAFSAGIQFATLQRKKQSFRHVLLTPAARIFRTNVSLAAWGVSTLSLAWHNWAVTWALDGVAGTALLALLAVELTPVLRRRLAADPPRR